MIIKYNNKLIVSIYMYNNSQFKYNKGQYKYNNRTDGSMCLKVSELWRIDLIVI